MIISGWVRTIREQKNFAFVEVNDGSILTSMQSVVDSSIASYGEVSKLSTGMLDDDGWMMRRRRIDIDGVNGRTMTTVL